MYEMPGTMDMAPERLIKGRGAKPLLVVVIASLDDLAHALRMRQPPDLFELRLDALCHDLEQIASLAKRLRAPLIITARHSAEGGLNNLASRQRRDLLLRFLADATYVDVELRSATELKSVLAAAERRSVGRIISFHDFSHTPSVGELARLAHLASALRADIFKAATRTDTREDVARLLRFFDFTHESMPISAMGMGRFGRSARRQLVRRGSALNYAPIGNAQMEGQLSLREMRQALSRSHCSVSVQEGGPSDS